MAKGIESSVRYSGEYGQGCQMAVSQTVRPKRAVTSYNRCGIDVVAL